MTESQKAMLNDLFTYHAPVQDQAERYTKLRDAAKVFAEVLLDCTPMCADQTYAIRQLRSCVMTANASIALESNLAGNLSQNR